MPTLTFDLVSHVLFHFKPKNVYVVCDRSTLQVLAATRQRKSNAFALAWAVPLDFITPSLSGERGQNVRRDGTLVLTVDAMGLLTLAAMAFAEYAKDGYRHLHDILDGGIAIDAVQRAILAIGCGVPVCGESVYVAHSHFANHPGEWQALRAEWQARKMTH